METKKENKKGFWASLFSPKPCACSCGNSFMMEEENEKKVAPSATCVSAKEVKVLGPGCAKCKATYSAMEKIIDAYQLDVKLTKVDDMAEIMTYNILSTPAVVVDGEVRLKGHVPTEAEVKTLLGI